MTAESAIWKLEAALWSIGQPQLLRGHVLVKAVLPILIVDVNASSRIDAAGCPAGEIVVWLWGLVARILPQSCPC